MAPNAKTGLPKLIIPEANGTKELTVENDSCNDANTNIDKPVEEEDIPSVQSFTEKLFSWRWRISIIINLANFVTMNIRGSMAMSLVCMAGSGVKTLSFTNSTLNYSSAISDNMTSLHSAIPEYEFEFDKSTRGIILSGTMYSGLFAPFLGGILSSRFGAKRFIFISMAVAGISTILIPSMTRVHVYLLVGLRVIVGICTIGNLPAFQDIWSSWAPQMERVSLVAFSISGINFANMFSALLSGFLCTIPIDNGWPFIFYLTGSMCILWCLLWYLFVSNTPEEHKLISDNEKKYILNNRVGMGGKKKTNPPWKKILTSSPVWAFIIVQTCNMFCAVTLFIQLPVYFYSILGFPIEMTGVLLSIPFFCRFVGSLFWGFMSDLLLQKTRLGITKIRKIVQFLAFVMSAITSGLVTFVPVEYKAAAVVLIGVLLFFQSGAMASSAIIPLDIAPRFAGVITGAFLMFGSILGVTASMVTTILVYGGTREVEWRIVFFMLSGFYIFGIIVFLLWGSAELQHWAVDEADKTEGDGISNIAFEIEVPLSDKYSTNGTKLNGCIINSATEATNRMRTISNTSSLPRTPTISVALVQTSEIGTPELIMKFPHRRNIPKSPISRKQEPPSFKNNTQDPVDSSIKLEVGSPVLDINTAVLPLSSAYCSTRL